MPNTIMIGCDLHDRNMLLRVAVGKEKPVERSFSNERIGRGLFLQWIDQLKRQHHCQRIVLAYEASGLGFGFSDLLQEHDIECYVLSPNQLPKTPKSSRQKTDSKDAQMLLEQVRGFVLAGNPLPVVWIPPQRLRDDRELVRARIDTADDTTRIKLQILSTLKRFGIEKPSWYTSRWSKRFILWLGERAAELDPVVRPVVESLIGRYELYRQEQAKLEKAILQLSREDRYREAYQALRALPGVGLVVAMTFLTEMGDCHRFANRRQVAAYLGLCPASYESGQADDRKGRITRQGPSRVRKVLCQAAWVSIRDSEEIAADYQRIKGGRSGRTKKALVAVMRRLSIVMWHRVCDSGDLAALRGRGGPLQLTPSGGGLVT